MTNSIPGSWGTRSAALLIFAFLLLFLVIPVSKVIFVAFQDPHSGSFTLINFVDFFNTQLFRESFLNSLYVASMSVILASIFAIPLAYFTTRFNFGGAVIIQTLGVIPLIMPPFVGAVAMQLLFGDNGSINLLLDEHFGFTIPFMQGLNGVILVESIHYFPFILINLSAALDNIDRAMEESAQNLGSYGVRLFRRIVFPLAMPGYIAGAALVFLKVFDDLGTPLLLNVNNMLAPQAYLRISSIGRSRPGTARHPQWGRDHSARRRRGRDKAARAGSQRDPKTARSAAATTTSPSQSRSRGRSPPMIRPPSRRIIGTPAIL
ncbi:MAG: ABC transporter permease subunit [Desulfuromonadales bacterium]